MLWWMYAPETTNDGRHVPRSDGCELIDFECGQIRPQHPQDLSFLFHEGRFDCAARDRLDSERAATRVEVEHPYAFQISKAAEQCLANPVGCRSNLAAGSPKASARQTPPDHPKAMIRATQASISMKR